MVSKLLAVVGKGDINMKLQTSNNVSVTEVIGFMQTSNNVQVSFYTSASMRSVTT